MSIVKLNAQIEEKVKSKKLKLGEDKCHVLHVGKAKTCLNLQVHGIDMENVKSEKYLGQYISSDGKNDKNVEDRCNKGIGMYCQMFVILNDVSLGRHFFHIGLLLRETNLVNGMLLSAESWYGLTRGQIESLENVDIQYFRKIFGSHSKTAKETSS